MCIWLVVCESVYDSVHTTALLVSIVRFVTWKLINFLVLVLGWMHVSAVIQQIESPLVVTSCHIPSKKIPFACPAPLQVATIQDDQQREQALTNAWFDQCLQNVFRHHHLSHSAGPMFQWSIHWSFNEMTQDIRKDYIIAISRWSEYIMILFNESYWSYWALRRSGWRTASFAFCISLLFLRPGDGVANCKRPSLHGKHLARKGTAAATQFVALCFSVVKYRGHLQMFAIAFLCPSRVHEEYQNNR